MSKKKKTPLVILGILVVGSIITTINYNIYLSKNMITESVDNMYIYNNAAQALDTSNNLEASSAFENGNREINPNEILDNNYEEDTEFIIYDNADILIAENSDAQLEVIFTFSVDNYENRLKSLSDNYETIWSQVDKSDMNATKKLAESEYDDWDHELNLLYSYLRENMNLDDFEKLKEEEITWINSKEDYARQAAKEYTGNYYNLAYTKALIDITKDRTYYLLDIVILENEKN